VFALRASKHCSRELVGSVSSETLKTQLGAAVAFSVAVKLALFRAGVPSDINYCMKKNVTAVAASAAHPASSLPRSSLPRVSLDNVSWRRSGGKEDV